MTYWILFHSYTFKWRWSKLLSCWLHRDTCRSDATTEIYTWLLAWNCPYLLSCWPAEHFRERIIVILYHKNSVYVRERSTASVIGRVGPPMAVHNSFIRTGPHTLYEGLSLAVRHTNTATKQLSSQDSHPVSLSWSFALKHLHKQVLGTPRSLSI